MGLTKVDLAAPLHRLLADAPSTAWHMADIAGAICYVRGSQKLTIPDEFRGSFPKDLLERLQGWNDPVKN